MADTFAQGSLRRAESKRGEFPSALLGDAAGRASCQEPCDASRAGFSPCGSEPARCEPSGPTMTWAAGGHYHPGREARALARRGDRDGLQMVSRLVSAFRRRVALSIVTCLEVTVPLRLLRCRLTSTRRGPYMCCKYVPGSARWCIMAANTDLETFPSEDFERLCPQFCLDGPSYGE